MAQPCSQMSVTWMWTRKFCICPIVVVCVRGLQAVRTRLRIIWEKLNCVLRFAPVVVQSPISLRLPVRSRWRASTVSRPVPDGHHPGKVINLSDEDQAAFIQQRGKHQLPTAFVKVEADLDHLVDEFGSNHISGVAGSWVRELEILCEMLDIEAVVMDEILKISRINGRQDNDDTKRELSCCDEPSAT